MTKLDVISGFLGAGKTTLIEKILEVCAENGERVVLIENEFGEIGIDGPALRMTGVEVYEISKGCVCCSLKGEFTVILKDILSSIKPDRIIFEPSGIFVLDEIFDIMKNTDISKFCVLNTVITVVDAQSYILQNERYSCFFENQIERADVLILSKSQLVDAPSLQSITKTLTDLNPGAKVIDCNWQHLKANELQAIIDSKILNCQNNILGQSDGTSHIRLQSWGTRKVRRFSVSELKAIVADIERGHYGSVVRGKGFFRIGEAVMSFNYAGGRYELARSSVDSDGIVCFIGESLDEKKLENVFVTEQC